MMNFVKCFSLCLLRWSYDFLIIWSFSWCNTLIDLHKLNHPCILRVNPTWSWWLSFSTRWECGLLIFWWGFLHLSSLGILAYNFLFLLHLWFWYQANAIFIKFGSIPSASVFEGIWEGLVLLLLGKFDRITSELIQSWTLVCWEELYYWLTSLSSNEFLLVFCLIMINS